MNIDLEFNVKIWTDEYSGLVFLEYKDRRASLCIGSYKTVKEAKQALSDFIQKTN